MKMPQGIVTPLSVQTAGGKQRVNCATLSLFFTEKFGDVDYIRYICNILLNFNEETKN